MFGFKWTMGTETKTGELVNPNEKKDNMDANNLHSLADRLESKHREKESKGTRRNINNKGNKKTGKHSGKQI